MKPAEPQKPLISNLKFSRMNAVIARFRDKNDVFDLYDKNVMICHDIS